MAFGPSHCPQTVTLCKSFSPAGSLKQSWSAIWHLGLSPLIPGFWAAVSREIKGGFLFCPHILLTSIIPPMGLCPKGNTAALYSSVYQWKPFLSFWPVHLAVLIFWAKDYCATKQLLFRSCFYWKAYEQRGSLKKKLFPNGWISGIMRDIQELFWDRGPISKVPSTASLSLLFPSLNLSIIGQIGWLGDWSSLSSWNSIAVTWWGRAEWVHKLGHPLGPCSTLVQRLINTLKSIHNKERETNIY